ncbi:MAG TPA: hypothetical protein VMD02_07440 [Candidatus Omnitrophota bacterium]|nr:hypothetical protein [Candidatus Omnitrophota bacterium]
MSGLLNKAEALILLLIGGFIGYLFASGRYYFYLTDQNRWLFIFSSGLFIVLGGYNIFNGRLAGKPLRVILFLMILLMALLLPPRIITPADLLQSPF